MELLLYIYLWGLLFPGYPMGVYFRNIPPRNYDIFCFFLGVVLWPVTLLGWLWVVISNLNNLQYLRIVINPLVWNVLLYNPVRNGPSTHRELTWLCFTVFWYHKPRKL